MSYEVLARKWRPQQFDDVVGQEHVTRTLKNAIGASRIAHAYLFVGPRGIGKTSVARIFAKALNCEKGTSGDPCDRCDSCREIAAGNSLDVMEIDGASNNSVDQIRDLRDSVKFMPTRGRFKIYIIDEVHMLSASAFNALLKTLEEPPAHVKFIFATTEPDKILATIVSRCQRFDLRRIPVAMIVERLRHIVTAEKVTVEEDALLAIARGAEGGLRDAESALDQLISFKGGEIREEDVLAVFGLTARRTLEQMVDAILAGDIPALMAAVGSLDAGGKDLQRVVGELLQHCRHLLVFLHVPDGAGLADVTEAQRETLRRQAAGADTERLLLIARVLVEAEERIRYALSKRALLEIALVRCARAARSVTLEELLRRVLALEQGRPAEAPAAGGGAGAARRPAEPPARDGGEPARPAAEARAPAPAPAAPAAGRTARPAEPAPDAAGDLERLGQAWAEIVQKVEKLAVGAHGALADARPARVDGSRVHIGFDPEFAEHQEAMNAPRKRRALEQALSAALGRQVTAVYEAAASGAAARGGGPAAPAAPAPKAGRAAPAPAAGERPAARSRRDLVEDPAVRKAQDLFQARIVDVRE